MTGEPQDEFRIGDVVAIAPSYKYAFDWPGSYIVVGIQHEYQREEGRLNIAIASAEEIEKKYGHTDGFRPQDLVRLMAMDGPEVARLKRVIERDRSKIAEVSSAVRKAIRAREWLRLGRGSYEYDDDRWKDEFGAALDEIMKALEPLRQIAGDLSDSPVKWNEVAEARRELSEVEKRTEQCAKIAEEHLRDVSFLASSPPQSSAAWNIRNKIRALL